MSHNRGMLTMANGTPVAFAINCGSCSGTARSRELISGAGAVTSLGHP
jgi:hypothetical protein